MLVRWCHPQCGVEEETVRRELWALPVAAVVGWGLAAVFLDQYGLVEGPLDGVEVVVVAGAGVMPGGVPGDALLARTRRAVALHQDGVGTRLAFTGGVGDWPPAEAEVSRALAMEWGVDDADIVVEMTSTSTEENAAHLATLIGPDARIVVVTDGYHVLRVERVFGRHFASVRGVGVRSPLGVRAFGAVREVAAVVLYAVTGRL
jgi:uncharacterized SAM-binding protein YcdF (DUF218 family)